MGNIKKFMGFCPSCGKEIFYSSRIVYNELKRKNSLCKPCSLESRKKELSTKMSGKGNPMYGKSVYEVWVQRYGEEEAKIREQKRTQSLSKSNKGKKHNGDSSGNKNPMYGKSVYSVWLQKYGKEEADKRLIDFKEKCRKRSIGKNNNMYGKPAPLSSGSGWNGWYRGLYFRSLRELSYMIKMDKMGVSWKSAENIIIPFEMDSVERTYRPDFIIENKYIIEIKPGPLQHIRENTLKFEAGRKYCKDRGLIYKVRDCRISSIDNIISLQKEGKLIFSDKYKKKFQEFLKSGQRTTA